MDAQGHELRMQQMQVERFDDLRWLLHGWNTKKEENKHILINNIYTCTYSIQYHNTVSLYSPFMWWASRLPEFASGLCIHCQARLGDLERASSGSRRIARLRFAAAPPRAP